MNDLDESLQETARAIAARLPPGTAFILLAADFGDGPGRRCGYVTNLNRQSAIELVDEFRANATGEQWGKLGEGSGPTPPGLTPGPGNE